MNPTALLVGIGSPHGDDRVGWEVARRAGERLAGKLLVRCAAKPAELLDWLEGIESLEVCDAVADAEVAGSVRCWRWPDAEIERTVFRGSHDLSLAAVLALAERLGRLPERARIWGVAIRRAEALDGLSLEGARAVSAAVEQICGALFDA
jgi:hydrogenase maturation protease